MIRNSRLIISAGVRGFSPCKGALLHGLIRTILQQGLERWGIQRRYGGSSWLAARARWNIRLWQVMNLAKAHRSSVLRVLLPLEVQQMFALALESTILKADGQTGSRRGELKHFCQCNESWSSPQPIPTRRMTLALPSGRQSRLDLESRATDRRAVSAAGSGAGLARPAPTRRRPRAGSRPATTHRRHGVQRSARGLWPLDGTADCPGGRETQVGAQSRTRDNPGLAPKPRSEAVAGKKCGASLSLMVPTSRRWKMSWPSMRNPMMPPSRSSAWTRNPSLCPRTCARRGRWLPARSPNGITNTRAVARPMFSAP